MRTEVEQQIDAWRDASNLFAADKIDEETLRRVRDSLLQPIEVTAKRIDELKDSSIKWAESLGDGMQSAFAGFLSGAEMNFKDFLKRLAAEWISSQIFAGIGSLVGGPTTFLGKLFGGFRANGGPVSAGRAYVVGERGPELFMPGAGGTIAPNGAGGLTYAPSYSIDARGADPSVEPRIRAMLADHGRRQKAEIADLMRRGRFP